jgi:DNA polymerase-3 subunit gamma/tau
MFRTGDRILALAGHIDPESVQLYYQIATQGREDIHLAPDEHAGFTMTLLRMLAFRPDDGAAETAPARESRPAAAPVPKAPVAGAVFDGDWPKLSRQLDGERGGERSWRATPSWLATRMAAST